MKAGLLARYDGDHERKENELIERVHDLEEQGALVPRAELDAPPMRARSTKARTEEGVGELHPVRTGSSLLGADAGQQRYPLS